MPFFVAKGGFKRALANWVGVEGAWKRVSTRWVGVNGQWRVKFRSGLLAMVSSDIRGFSEAPDLSYARIDFAPNGTVTGSYTQHTALGTEELPPWYDPKTANIGGQFQIRAIRVAGSQLVEGSALDVWLPLTQTRGWQLSGVIGTGNFTHSVTLRIELRANNSDHIIAGTTNLSAMVYNYDGGGGGEGRGRYGGINRDIPPQFAR